MGQFLKINNRELALNNSPNESTLGVATHQLGKTPLVRAVNAHTSNASVITIQSELKTPSTDAHSSPQSRENFTLLAGESIVFYKHPNDIVFAVGGTVKFNAVDEVQGPQHGSIPYAGQKRHTFN